MKILLLQPPENMEKILGNGKHFAKPLPPSGIMYIGSYLEKKGYNVKIIDAYFYGYDVNKTVAAILNEGPSILGISCLTSNGANVYAIVRAIKKIAPKIKIVLGNIHASVFSSFYIKNAGADFVIHNEGEETLKNLLDLIGKNKTIFSEIKDLSWKKGKEAVNNKKNDKTLSLDEIPWPARHLVPFIKYTDGKYKKVKNKNVDVLFSSRGCVNKCTFCCIGSREKYRYREPIDVVDEMSYVHNKYGINIFEFGDPLFTFNKQRIIKICEEILRRNMKISWECEGHAKFITEDMLMAMKAAGCTGVYYGIESGTPRILKEIRKNASKNDIEKAIKNTNKMGIRPSGLFMLGFPGETEEEMFETMKFSVDLPLESAQFAITTPYPGTSLYYELINKNEIKLKDEDDPGFVEDWYRYSAYSSYTDVEPIWLPMGITSKRLKQIQKIALRNFYFRPTKVYSQIKKIKFSSVSHVVSLAKAIKDSFL
ncbi:MAG: radical SAM protein [Candidatus Aureabacteria bacterium]|nr:radical SAM protein [Candidatus Auribacterota bacterium]